MRLLLTIIAVLGLVFGIALMLATVIPTIDRLLVLLLTMHI